MEDSSIDLLNSILYTYCESTLVLGDNSDCSDDREMYLIDADLLSLVLNDIKLKFK